jgi:sulfite exporter TauE/SafE
MPGIIAIFLASLAGSPHCAAMCGPFLAFAAAGDIGHRPRWSVTGAYHAGRLAAYVALGLAAGSLGAGVETLGARAGLSRMAALVAGTVMVAWGMNTILVLRGRRPVTHAPQPLQRALGRVTQKLRGMSGVERAAITGCTTALLPCGWLYAFVAAAGGTGSPATAAMVMIFFWTGTLPLMTALGLGFQRLAGPLRRSLPLVTASVVVAIGLLTIAGRLRLPAPNGHAHGAQVGADHR